jgi:ectoine hydroxylase-related dioxygenase (phytanoyl-CoA dioxygenase family)
MGPTIFLPGTHTKEAHTAFYGGSLEAGRDKMGLRIPPIPEAFLRSCPVRLSTLRAGDVALYNQQVLHCGSANDSPDRMRRQFYVSFRDASVQNVEARASIRPALQGKLTLGEVRAELRGLKAGGGGVFEALDAADADPERTREARIANGGRSTGSSNGPRPIEIL